MNRRVAPHALALPANAESAGAARQPRANEARPLRPARSAENAAVRPLAEADLEAARSLVAELGCELTQEEIRSRFASIAAASEHAVFAAERDGRVVGVMHLYCRPAFDKPPEVVVQAIVVEAACRGLGIGKMLMSTAEAWARDKRYRTVSLYSNAARAAAHDFYRSLGYDRVATSHLFRRAT